MGWNFQTSILDRATREGVFPCRRTRDVFEPIEFPCGRLARAAVPVAVLGFTPSGFGQIGARSGRRRATARLALGY